MKTDIEIASAWRSTQQDTNRRATGVVVVYGCQVAGWMNELRNPDHWVPGAVAVDLAGKCWIAEGGSERRGALQWVPHGN